MKKIFFICSFILIFYYQSFSQLTNKKDDSLIYQCIVNQPGFNFNKNNTPICDTAYLEVLKEFDFKKTNLDKWKGKGIITDWKDFFDQINIDTLKEYKLTVNKIGRHPFITRDLNKARDYKHPFLSLSPVIYSPDKSLAVCSIWDYGNPESGSKLIYLLQFKDNEWTIVKFLLVSIS
jgi:hypothetical protein